ncbi:Golgi apparatus protein 1-like [Paramacrobiotus metropolitanus]|uniref:Golgi apparatus protein 1-like n=1 Tax=Paramacrobiotus metropolitanus TaxID=2943436 RepID=UPI002445CB17|nr:Golgi apparatus protein 1-like [Paramacrobiotus metropolitanus]
MLTKFFPACLLLCGLCLRRTAGQGAGMMQPIGGQQAPAIGTNNAANPLPVNYNQGVGAGNAVTMAAAAASVDDSDIINLAEHPACAADVRRLCEGMPNKKDPDATKEAKNSLDVLNCFLDHEDKAVSAGCHQIMYDFKKNITKDPRIANIADAQCKDDLTKTHLATCASFRKSDPGHFISCVVEHKDEITDESCLAFVNKVAVVIFSDFRFVSPFMNACAADQERLKCKFLDNDGQSKGGHSQGAVVQCLLHEMQQLQRKALEAKANQQDGQGLQQMPSPENQLAPECAHQLMRLLELQADDYHLDRALFLACRDDRETFCRDVQAGQGRVYQCLMRSINEARMTTECKARLEEREVAAQTDYKVDYGLGQACKDEISRYNCVPPSTHPQEYGMSFIILCLEDPMRKEAQHQVGPKCQDAMQYHRQALMNDHNVSPNILVFCKTDIERHCSKKGVQPQAYVHCLMGAAQPHLQKGPNGQAGSYASQLAPVCERELKELLLTADPASDMKVDLVLYQACANVIHNRCGGDMHAAALHMMGCLMENMHAQEMTEDCEKRLLESHYFMTRDIRLDTELFRACKDSVGRVCGLKDDWLPQEKNRQGPDVGPIVFGCLYRHAVIPEPDKDGLSDQCKAKVFEMLHQRAVARELPPKIDTDCIHDLAYFCSDRPPRKGQEMNCLQDNYAKLQTECKAAVQGYLQAVNKDAKLSATYYNCANMLEKFCRGSLDQGSTFDDAMQCLIPYKEDVGMEKNCKAEIEHYQMVNIQEFNLNFRFKEACRVDRETFCKGPNGQPLTDIGELVVCLSSLNREDIVNGAKPRISDACRKQLRSELLTRVENVELDPYIKKVCGNDIDKVCRIPNQLDTLECLRRQDPKTLSSECAAVVFKVEMVQAAEPEADFALLKACKRMIKKFCPDEETTQVLTCLIGVKKEPEMDDKCRKMIITRQMEEGKDVRLNAGLFKECKKDMDKFCRTDLEKLGSRKVEAPELEATIVECLRRHRKQISGACDKQITTLFKEVVSDYQLDKNLVEVCHEEILSCHKSDDEEKGEVVECLKQQLKAGKMRTPCALRVSHLVAEGKADLHVDPQLFSACHDDLRKFCREVDAGEGRQFQCLSAARSDGHKLTVQCDSKLKERIEFVKYATKDEPMDNIGQIVDAVVDSPARHYVFAVLGGALCAVLCIGICCGRATKRVRRELKNR